MKSFVKRNKTVLALIPVIAVMIMIFCFSAQDAEESGKTSSVVVEKVIEVVEPEYDEMPAEKQGEIWSEITHIVRKTGHFSEFALLGFFTLLYLVTWKKKPFLYGMWAELFCIVYAATDELHQMLSPGRGPGVTDVLIDSAGALAGILLSFFIVKTAERKKHGERRK